LLYSAYAILVQHWLPWVILGLIWSLVFLPNMVMKEASISRYPGWAEYKKRTGMLLPWL
jgi:protein-S-isoprenylcysteine O-methyltransferase Ste14